MNTYDIDFIKKRLAAFTEKNGSGSKTGKKIVFWKPEIGEHDVRVLPYRDENGQPFQEVLYYDKFATNRIVAPHQFGMDDPIQKLRKELFAEKDAGKRKLLKYLNSKERFYALILDRAHEDKGVQVWEMSKELCKKFYAILAHKDYQDEDVFSPETGYDFTVNVTVQLDGAGNPKLFNGKQTKAIDITIRRKPSKLHAKAAEVKRLLESVPNLSEYFKAQSKSPEEIQEVLENFIASLEMFVTPQPEDQPIQSDADVEGELRKALETL